MTTVAGDVVEVVRRIAARPETVWSFFTDPARYSAWQGQDAELDPRPGGVFRVTMTGRTGAVARGVFVELDPPRRLVLTWGWEQADWLPEAMRLPVGSTTVEVVLVPDGEGTVLRLRHGGLPSPAACRFHRWGWGVSLDRLTSVAAGGDRAGDPFGAL